MNEVILEAKGRELSTKQALKALKAGGQIPAVFYGHNEKSVAVAVDAKEFDKLIHSGSASGIITLKFDGASKPVIIKEVQRDVLTQAPIHIDFQGISLKEKVELDVPVHVFGTSPGVKLHGGILEFVTRELTVRCLPTDIPQSINVDVSALELNQSVTVKDLPEFKGVEIMQEPDVILVTVVAPSGTEEAPAAGEAAAATATAEPEVITKGKKEKEGEAAASPEKKK